MITGHHVLIQGLAPERRGAIYRETAKALAALHSVDVDAIGLGIYGRREHYCKRQVVNFSVKIASLLPLFNIPTGAQHHKLS